MKNIKLFFQPLFMVVMGLFLLLGACNSTLKPVEVRIKDAVDKYLMPLQVDSFRITKIDTLSSAGYARLMIETLENMRIEMEFQYKEAVFLGDDSTMNIIDSAMLEIDNVLDYFLFYTQQQKDTDTPDTRDILLYMVSVNYYLYGNETPTCLFLTPDMQVHELDPFRHNLLEKPID
ncbi:MAG: hypothetical protein LBR51_00805 [Bacteroidales bacterium]|jgi:hypothetical protein|nr:hypothetical protein [Bacteroidales bacterium]